MEKIWKYSLNFKPDVSFPMPVAAEILSLQAQNGNPCLWVKFQAKNEERLVNRRFRTYGTGWTIEPIEGKRQVFIDTYQAGEFVWHVFEVVDF
jgi:hypothetical protein